MNENTFYCESFEKGLSKCESQCLGCDGLQEMGFFRKYPPIRDKQVINQRTGAKRVTRYNKNESKSNNSR